MRDKSMSVFQIAWKTICRQHTRSCYTIILVAVLSFAVFCGALLMDGAERGVNNTADRLGADLMVVPQGHDVELEGVLLRSEPSTFYFKDDSIVDAIQKMHGVKTASAQLYLQSLDAECCSVPVQLIVFDEETDFTIKPWIESSIEASRNELENEVWIGALVEAYPGDIIVLYGQEFKVVGRMEETGSGFDSSIFMEMHTAERMIEGSKSSAEQIACEDTDLISCVMVRLNDECSVVDVTSEIRKIYPEAEVVETEHMLESISGNLRLFSSILRVMIAGIWLMAVIVLSVTFAVSLSSRRREFGMFRMIGATKGKLVSLVLLETGIVCLIGAVLGCFIGCIIVVPFKTLIASAMNMPYIVPDTVHIVGFAVVSMLISVFTGPLTCMFFIRRITGSETFLLIRD